MLVSVVLVIGSFLLNAGGAWKFHESVSLAMTIGWVGATWRSYAVRGAIDIRSRFAFLE